MGEESSVLSLGHFDFLRASGLSRRNPFSTHRRAKEFFCRCHPISQGVSPFTDSRLSVSEIRLLTGRSPLSPVGVEGTRSPRLVATHGEYSARSQGQTGALPARVINFMPDSLGACTAPDFVGIGCSRDNQVPNHEFEGILSGANLGVLQMTRPLETDGSSRLVTPGDETPNLQ